MAPAKVLGPLPFELKFLDRVRTKLEESGGRTSLLALSRGWSVSLFCVASKKERNFGYVMQIVLPNQVTALVDHRHNCGGRHSHPLVTATFHPRRETMHRLGGVGIAAFDRQKLSTQSYAHLSNELSRTQVDNLQAQLTLFRESLLRFASTHREDIRKDPNFRHAFQQMCSNIGVDPLAGPRKGGWWAEALDLGDWQYELGVQIVDVCVSTRERNGGLIEMSELVRILTKLRGLGAGAITEEDVIRSIKTLKPLGAGYEVIEMDGGKKMVRSVVKQLDQDQAVVLSVAQAHGGKVDEQMLVREKGWTEARAQTALQNMLLRDGLCWLDEQGEGNTVLYWVPSAMQWDP